MPTITRVSWRPFAISLRQAFGAAHGTTSVREGVVVRIETDEGYLGLGEASPLPTFVAGTVTDVLAHMEAEARGLLAAANPFEGLRTHPFREDGLLEPHGAAGARLFATQVALGDVAAQSESMPFFRWFAERSGLPAFVRAVEDSPNVPVNAVIGGLPPDLAAEQARQQYTAGFRVFKVKVGLDLESDIDRVHAVRDAIGPDAELRLDANGGWSFETAFLALDRLEGARIAVLEQPSPPGPGAFDAFEALGLRFPGTTIAADESLQHLLAAYEWHTFADRDTPRLGTVLKPMVSGLGEFLCMYQLADVGRPVIVTTTIDAGIATLAAMHVAACLPRPRAACGLSTLDMLEGDIVSGVPPVVNGAVTLPETPGLGVTLDEDALERYATGPWQEVRR